MRKAFLNLRHHIWRQVIDQVSDLVGIERFNRVDEFVAVHRFDQGLTNALVDFEQNIAVRLTLDLIPDSKTVVKRQGFEYPSNVGRMEGLQNVTQLLRGFRRQRTRFIILVILIGLFTAPRFCASGFFGLFTSFSKARARSSSESRTCCTRASARLASSESSVGAPAISSLGASVWSSRFTAQYLSQLKDWTGQKEKIPPGRSSAAAANKNLQPQSPVRLARFKTVRFFQSAGSGKEAAANIPNMRSISPKRIDLFPCLTF